jgi:hypothetical protein
MWMASSTLAASLSLAMFNETTEKVRFRYVSAGVSGAAAKL